MSETVRRPRRLWWAAGVLGVLVVLALSGAPERSPEPSRPEEPAAPAATNDSAPAIAPSAGRPRTTRPAVTDVVDLPPQIQRFLEANQYPPTSRPLTADAEDLLYPNQRYEKPQPLDEDGDVTFVFTADRYYYTGDEVAHVWLEVLKEGEPVPVQLAHSTARAEGGGGSAGTLVDLGLRPAGTLLSSDLSLQNAFPGHHGSILLEVAFRVDGGELHDAAIRIFSTPVERVPARLTGDVRDSVDDGSLRVEVGVDVLEAGFYRFDANLYDRDGAPIAYSVFKGDLAPGEQWLPLEFYGKVLRDQGAVGPYSVEQIRGYRFLEGQTPDREQLVDDSLTHLTSAYDVGVFTDAEYTSEHKERMLDLMLEDLENDRSLDIPTVAAAR